MTTRHRITTTTAAAILSLAAAAAPPAGARPADFVPASRPAPSLAYSRPDKSVIPATMPEGGAVPGSASTRPIVVRVQAPPSGFDWGDAGIGAGGGFALSMIGIGGALVVSARRTHRGKTALTR